MNEPRGNRSREILLTENQHRIIERLIAGDTVPEIARAKHRSILTVRTTVRTVYQRFGVHSVSELAAAIASPEFRIHIVDVTGRKRTLRSGLRAIREALVRIDEDNKRSGRKRRRASISLAVEEMTAILSACEHAADDALAARTPNVQCFIEPQGPGEG